MSFPPVPPPPPREPAFNLPGVIVWLIGLLLLIEAGRAWLDPLDDFRLLAWAAFVPARLTLWLGTARPEDIAGALANSSSGEELAARMQLARLLLGEGSVRLWTLASYALLHGGWLHVISNAIWLAAFGSPVARRLGSSRFLSLMGLSAIAGALLHWWSREFDVVPLVGASAAVAGAMAAAARFVFAPGLPFGALGDERVVRAIPVEPLTRLLSNGRAGLFILIWFVTNILFGSGLVPILGEETSIAWEAHIGGFLAGLLLFPLLDPRRPG